MKYYLVLSFLVLVSCNKEAELNKILQKNVEEIVYVKGSDFKNEGYCYFVYQAIIDPRLITPQTFTLYVKGATLSTKYLSEYYKWLNGEMGRLCKSIIGERFKKIEINSSKAYMILLNKEAITIDHKDFKTVKNHEKLHVLYSLYKKHHFKVQEKWDLENTKFKKSFIKSHPGYNFNKTDILLREYFSYTFQNELEKGYDFIN